MQNTVSNLVESIAHIIAAYVANNPVAPSELPGLISSVSQSLRDIDSDNTPEPDVMATTPAVPIKKSITPDYIICLEDGQKFKSMARHLSAAYGMTPDDYRTKWSLPSRYPMVAPNYSVQRSQLSKTIGLGRSGRTNTKNADKARKQA